MKPTNKKMAELIINRLKNDKYSEQGIRVINKILTHGEFDFIIMFAAKNHSLARRYFDSIRLAYDEWLLEKPMIVDIDFSIVREGKINPELNKLFECIPQ